MRFLAIDFETANSKRSSICAYGFALFENGQLIESGSDICRPEPDYFDPWNIRVHGITPDKTAGLSGFENHIEKIFEYKPDFLVAHNASFDISCIRNWCDVTNHAYPHFDYLCTLVSSRLLFPTAPRHTLDTICRMHHIPLNHHEAGSDAVACGLIMQKSIEIVGAKSHKDFCKKLSMHVGNVCDNGYTPCVARNGFPMSCIRDKKPMFERISEIDCIADPELAENNPLNGANICFTGELIMSNRHDAALMAAKRGAIPQDNVTKCTNFLVVGYSDLIDFENGKKTSKLVKAEQYIQSGSCLQIISEDEFVDLLVNNVVIK